MLALSLLLALQLQIPAPTGYVNDFAGIISDGARQSLLAVIDEVRQKSGGEIVVVTLADLGGRPSIDVGRDLIRQWKIGGAGGAGDRARNASVVILLKPGQRPGDGQAEIAVSTGTGAEGFVTDAAAGRIRDAIGAAAVDAGRYDAGLVAGVQAVGTLYAREFGFEFTGVAAPPPSARRAPAAGRFLSILVFIILMIIISRRRRRGGLVQALIWNALWSSGSRRGGGWGGGGRGGWGGSGGGFGGFGGGGGSMGGGASGRF